MGVGSTPRDDNGAPVLALWNDATGQPIPIHVGATVTGADGKTYALLDVNATVSPAANQRVNTHAGDIAAGSAVDGWDVTQGAQADAAITDSTQTTKTKMAYIKGMVKMLADMWDSVNHWLQVKVMNGNANGQNTMSASQPVAIASDQSAIASKRTAVALFTTVQSTVGTGNSGDIAVGPYTELSIDITTSAHAGTTPTLQFFWSRKGADGIYYDQWASDILLLSANTVSVSIGAGMAYNVSLGTTGELRWVVGGTSTPTWTFSPNVTGK